MKVFILFIFVLFSFQKTSYSEEATENIVEEYFFRIDIQGTFLKVDTFKDDDHPGDIQRSPSFISFIPPVSKVKPGDVVRLQIFGAILPGEGPGFYDTHQYASGVFRDASGNFLNTFGLKRTTATSSPVTNTCNEERIYSNDIAQDFSLFTDRTIDVQIPPGASSMALAITDCYWRDNTDPNFDFGIWVKMVVIKPKAHIVKSVIDVADTNGIINLEPSVYGCGQLVTTLQKRVINFKCFDELEKPMEGCLLDVEMTKFQDSNDPNSNGGHDHEDQRPLGNLWDTPSKTVGNLLSPQSKLIPIPISGLNLYYEAPQAAGMVQVNFIGYDKDKVEVEAIPATIFKIKSNLEFVPFNDIANFDVVVKSHPGKGLYGIKKLHDQVSKLTKAYLKLASDSGVPESAILNLESQAVSLPWGGVFDYKWDEGLPWIHPHCGHRIGKSIDLSFKHFEQDRENGEVMKESLKNAIVETSLTFPVETERPSYPRADHWHADVVP